jgi:hypothetical protein
VVQRVLDWFSAGELRRDGAHKTIAGAGGIDGLNGAAIDNQRLAVDKREHAALAERDADGLVFAGLQRSRHFDEARIIVGIVKFGPGQETELGFIEDQNIDEIEQLAVEFDRWRRIEDRVRASRAGQSLLCT